MTENKNAPLKSIYNNFNNNIIAKYQENSNVNYAKTVISQNIQDVTMLKTPDILEEIIKDFIFPLFPDIKLSCIFVTLITLVATAFGHKYITLDENDDGSNLIFPNCFGLNISPSGMGKDRLTKNLQKKIFKPITDDVYSQIENYINAEENKIKQEAEMIEDKDQKKQFLNQNKVRNIVIEVSNATVEGFCEDCKATKKAHKSCILCINNEFGLFLIERDDRQKQFVNIIIPAYDGDIRTKSTKGENREKNIEGIFLNVLFYTDPTILKAGQVKELLQYLLAVGFVRRFFISYQNTMSLTIEENPIIQRKKEKDAYCRAYEISEKLYDIWKSVKLNSTFRLPDDVSCASLFNYRRKISKLCNETKDSTIYKELQSRVFKVMKLSTIYACLNHPTELQVKNEDVEQAISWVEYIANDFIKFLSFFESDNKSAAEKLFNILLSNLGQEFTKTDIAYHNFKELGYSKYEDLADKNTWKNLINEANVLAVNRGYILISKEHNGWKIKLEKALKDDYTNDNTIFDDIN